MGLGEHLVIASGRPAGILSLGKERENKEATNRRQEEERRGARLSWPSIGGREDYIIVLTQSVK